MGSREHNECPRSVSREEYSRRFEAEYLCVCGLCIVSPPVICVTDLVKPRGLARR
jgi:hypothetical protein